MTKVWRTQRVYNVLGWYSTKRPIWNFITELQRLKWTEKRASWLSVLFTLASDTKHGGCPIHLPYGLGLSTCLWPWAHATSLAQLQMQVFVWPVYLARLVNSTCNNDMGHLSLWNIQRGGEDVNTNRDMRLQKTGTSNLRWEQREGSNSVEDLEAQGELSWRRWHLSRILEGG